MSPNTFFPREGTDDCQRTRHIVEQKDLSSELHETKAIPPGSSADLQNVFPFEISNSG
jgi:hypothetical protein